MNGCDGLFGVKGECGEKGECGVFGEFLDEYKKMVDIVFLILEKVK